MLMANEDAEQTRLRIAEASFFIGQQLLTQGQPKEARRWFERAVQTQALPYREVTLAGIELQKLGGSATKVALSAPAGNVRPGEALTSKLLNGLGKGVGKLLEGLNAP
jgi:hypothetical protein